jgi:hypothetical protein
MVVKVALSLVPMLPKALTTTIAIKAAINPYSMAVAPVSSIRSWRNTRTVLPDPHSVVIG